uniref:Uncharacterized protein n=1 Tax=Globodera rostochiensis TaxID=31243 RepID=A0A914HIW6_GLORO
MGLRAREGCLINNHLKTWKAMGPRAREGCLRPPTDKTWEAMGPRAREGCLINNHLKTWEAIGPRAREGCLINNHLKTWEAMGPRAQEGCLINNHLKTWEAMGPRAREGCLRPPTDKTWEAMGPRAREGCLINNHLKTWEAMGPRAREGFFLSAKTFAAPNDVKSKQLLTFSPIVTELAQKIVEECLDEYKKMMAKLTTSNGRQPFNTNWVALHGILSKALSQNTNKNYQMIANSCQMSNAPPVVRSNGTILLLLRPESLFCDYGKSLAFVKRYFEELKETTKLDPEFVKEANEMFKKMNEANKQFLNIENFASDVENALIEIKFQHEFEAVDKIWARKMLTALAGNCKNYILDAGESRANRTNAFQTAVKAIRNVQLQPPNSNRNQTEIDETCAILYTQNPGKNLCMFAKKLAYLTKFNQMFGIPTNSFGCWLWPLNSNRNNAAAAAEECLDCLDIMRHVYEDELRKVTKWLWGKVKRQFLEKFAFDRQARDVENAIKMMFEKGKAN